MQATYKVTASSFADLMTVIQVLPLGKCSLVRSPGNWVAVFSCALRLPFLEDPLSQSGIRWEVS